MGHFDIKLENVLVGKHYNLKLCDFGLAKNLEETQVEMVGTESYVAPEIRLKKGFGGVGPDIYALGVVLFTMHFGQAPWSETTEKDK